STGRGKTKGQRRPGTGDAGLPTGDSPWTPRTLGRRTLTLATALCGCTEPGEDRIYRDLSRAKVRGPRAVRTAAGAGAGPIEPPPGSGVPAPRRSRPAAAAARGWRTPRRPRRDAAARETSRAGEVRRGARPAADRGCGRRPRSRRPALRGSPGCAGT